MRKKLAIVLIECCAVVVLMTGCSAGDEVKGHLTNGIDGAPTTQGVDDTIKKGK